MLNRPPEMKILSVLAKVSLKIEIQIEIHSALFHMKTRVCPKYFVNDYSLASWISLNNCSV